MDGNVLDDYLSAACYCLFALLLLFLVFRFRPTWVRLLTGLFALLFFMFAWLEVPEPPTMWAPDGSREVTIRGAEEHRILRVRRPWRLRFSSVDMGSEDSVYEWKMSWTDPTHLRMDHGGDACDKTVDSVHIECTLPSP